MGDKRLRVSRRNPCPICGKPDWCLIARDGSDCICARIESQKRAGDAGWLHVLGEQVKVYRPTRRERKQETNQDIFALFQKYTSNCKQPELLAEELGVSVSSLKDLQVGYSGKAYSFPMFSGNNRIIGIRLRAGKRKWAVKGSKAGLFVPVGRNLTSELWICEGPTDTAALLTLGFYAIGRPSCTGGVKHIQSYLCRTGKKDVYIMTDKDPPKKLADGRTWRPGLDGALRLAKEIKSICGTVRAVRPLVGKDIRQWLNSGATKEQVKVIADSTRCL